ncbi:hypothetical protein MKW94_020739 [Papaver nudicaule]|uniref:Uncharacterized protein n=1 Tax=Papaver nudicaule TaxID=74823 RepID=A0AA41RZW6_PAPNU|nr:hypothetical protein [Papaver nudicaule]
MHIYGKCSPFRPSLKSFSWEEEEAVFDMARNLQHLSSLVARRYDVPIASARRTQTMLTAMDASNDAAWVPSSGCAGCSSKLFDSTKFTSYRTLGSFSENLTQDTVQSARDLIRNYSFGCLGNVTGSSVPPQGLLGLGRGPNLFYPNPRISTNQHSHTVYYQLQVTKLLWFTKVSSTERNEVHPPLLKKPKDDLISIMGHS